MDRIKRMTSFMLAILMFVTLTFGAKPEMAQAAGETDIAITDVTVDADKNVTVKLYDVTGTLPDRTSTSVEKISYYVDGKLLESYSVSSIVWVNRTASIYRTNSIAQNKIPEDAKKLTVIISYAGDTLRANNNYTVVLSEKGTAVPDKYGMVTNLQVLDVTKTSATIRWEKPLEGTYTTEPTGYRIIVNGEIHDVSADVFEWKVSGLTSGKMCQYSVTALYGSYHSSECWGTFTTLPDDVTGVADLIATRVYTEPKDPKVGDPVFFKVDVKNVGNAPTVLKTSDIDKPVIGVSFSVDGNVVAWSDTCTKMIQAGETVTLTSNGGPDNGNGNWTAATAKTYSIEAYVDDQKRLDGEDNSNNKLTASLTVSVKEEIYAKVQNLGKKDITQNEATITWQKPIGYTTEPTGYMIEINGQTYTVGSATFEYRVNGLTSNTDYTFKVTALYGVNRSQEATASFKTQTPPAENPNGHPDLVVTDFYTVPSNPVLGQPVSLVAVVKNQGDKSVSSASYADNADHIIGVLFQYEDTTTPVVWSDNYEKDKVLAPGESVILTSNGGGSNGYWIPDIAKDYSIRAWVDDQNRISAETTKDNNFKTKTITVLPAPPVEIPDGGLDGEFAQVKTFQVPSGMTTSPGIQVKVNNSETGTFNATVNNSRKWDNKMYEQTPVSIFEMSEDGRPAKVRIGYNTTVNSVVIRPLSAGISTTPKSEGGFSVVEFDVKEPGSYSVEINGKTSGALQLFANPIMEVPEGATVVPAGAEWGGQTVSGTLYISGGARVNGQVVMNSDATIMGSGIITGGADSWTIGIHGKNTTKIKGITVVNPNRWVTEIRDSSNVDMDYYHIISANSNGDGVSIQSAHDIDINNCYFRTWDDGVVLKIYTDGDTYNVHVRDTVFWTDLAQSMEIGAETNKGDPGPSNSDPKIYDSDFINCDVIHAFHKPAMSIHNMDNAKVYGIKWENITVEDAQMGNNSTGGDGWPLLIDLTNIVGGEVPGTASSWTNPGLRETRGRIDNITFENIKVLSWENNEGKAPGIRILNSERGNHGTMGTITVNGLKYGDYEIHSKEAFNNFSIHNQFRIEDTNHDNNHYHDCTNHGSGNCSVDNITFK